MSPENNLALAAVYDLARALDNVKSSHPSGCSLLSLLAPTLDKVKNEIVRSPSVVDVPTRARRLAVVKEEAQS